MAELDWSWTEAVTNKGNAQQPQWTGPTNGQASGASGDPPTGTEAFPTWVNTTVNYFGTQGIRWRQGP